MSKNISIIISAFNEAPYIQETINSLNRFDDVTILDNNSSDDTVKIIERAQKYQSIKLYKNNIQKKPLQNMCFLINKSAYECIYFLGADDYLHVIEDVIIELPVKSYKIPYINYFDDGSRDVYCVYPEENWLSELLNAKDAASIVKAQLNYAGHDVHVLGLHSKINLIEACKNLKFNCVEGISFWLVLCSLLSAHMHGSPPIEIERRFSVFKRNNNLHATGTHSEKSTHNVQPKNIIEKSLVLLAQTLSSFRNSLFVISRYELDLISSLKLLFGPRRYGKDKAIFAYGPLFNIPYTFLKLVKIIIQKVFNSKNGS